MALVLHLFKFALQGCYGACYHGRNASTRFINIFAHLLNQFFNTFRIFLHPLEMRQIQMRMVLP